MQACIDAAPLRAALGFADQLGPGQVASMAQTLMSTSRGRERVAAAGLCRIPATVTVF
jgi:hypothetical protein